MPLVIYIELSNMKFKVGDIVNELCPCNVPGHEYDYTGGIVLRRENGFVIVWWPGVGYEWAHQDDELEGVVKYNEI